MPHINEKIDLCAEVFVVFNKRVLLRKHDKYNIWLSVGGHVELDEDPNEAAVREVKEEVGLDVELFHAGYPLRKLANYKELIPPRFLNRHKIDDKHEHVTLVFFATSKTDSLILSEKEKSDVCKWFTLDELDDPKYGIKEGVRMYAKAALEKVK